MIKRLRKYWNSKSVKQRIYICIGIACMITFMFFIIKGNFFDKRSGANSPAETSQVTEDAVSNDTNNGNETDEIHLHINWIDIGVLTAVLTAYGIHKYREKKREKRL